VFQIWPRADLSQSTETTGERGRPRPGRRAHTGARTPRLSTLIRFHIYEQDSQDAESGSECINVHSVSAAPLIRCEVIGNSVSAIHVQSWERGVREPSLLACRLLDVVTRDSAAWLVSLSIRPLMAAKPRWWEDRRSWAVEMRAFDLAKFHTQLGFETLV